MSATRADILTGVAGLVGVLSHDARTPVPVDELQRLARSYADVRGDGRVHLAGVGEWARCAKIDGHVAGPIARDGDAWCAFTGALHADQSPARAPLSDVDGQFAAVRGDAAAGRAEVLNDQFGMQALYVAEHEGRSYVSTSATALARHLGAAPDPLGAALFLRTGRQFGPVTHWKGVRRLDPATLLTFARAGRTETTYWHPHIDQRVRRMSLRQTAEHCAGTLVAALKRRLGAEPCMLADLTGGFDSRMITAALARAGQRFTVQTAADAETVDMLLARQVAEAGGLAWRRERLPDGWWPDPDALRTAAGWSDGMLEVLQLSTVLWRQRERGEMCRMVVTGGGGEHFGPQPWMQEFLRAGRSRRVNMDNLMSMRALTGKSPDVLRADPSAAVEAYMRAGLMRHARTLAGELNTSQLDAMYIYRTTGHFGAYRSASEAYVRTEIPAYYTDVFTAGFSAHHRFRNRHRLHRAIIACLHPVMGAVETERGGPAQLMRPHNAHRFAAYYWRLGRTAVRKIRRLPSPPDEEGIAEAGYRRAIGELRATGVLDPDGMRSGSLYDRDALTALLDRAQAPGHAPWSMVGRIITLELALRATERVAAGASR
jgi:hypothetical protein